MMTNDELTNDVSHERRFSGAGGRLRSPDRVARLEVPRVVALTLAGLTATNVLDVGTGTGIFAEAFANRGLAVTGIDTNAELLAREFAPGTEFKEARAEELLFEDQSFDLAFLGHVLHETDNPLTALTQARRETRGSSGDLGDYCYRRRPAHF